MIVQEAIILAGGLGTRLKEVVNDVPKVMAPVNGRPFLEYVLDYLERNIFNHVVLSVGYKYEVIKKHFGNRYKSIEIDYAIEDEPLGTGGGIKKAFGKIESEAALVFNGDTFFDVDLKSLITFRDDNNSDIVIVLRLVNDVKRFGSITNDKENIITDFSEKNIKSGKGYINGGIYFFEKYHKSNKFYAFHSSSYFRDIGIPEDYFKAQDEFKKLSY